MPAGIGSRPNIDREASEDLEFLFDCLHAELETHRTCVKDSDIALALLESICECVHGKGAAQTSGSH